MSLSDNTSDSENEQLLVSKGSKGGFLSNAVRGLVSKKKLRFQKDGFDLDLSYITERIISMGYPSIGKEATYRNRREDVKNFFAKYHQGHFKVYNLCSEKPYEGKEVFCTKSLNGHYGYFPFDDHNPCTFEMLLNICRDMDAFLKADPVNVVAIHCKAGKGRTGTVVCAYLLFCGICTTANDALNYFGQRRTRNNKGVTIPSQQRYVRYMEEYMRLEQKLQVPITISSFSIHTCPHFDVGGGSDPYFVIWQDGKKIYSMKKDKTRKIIAMKPTDKRIDFDNINIDITGDIKLVFKDYDFMSADDKMFTIWFNTSFIHQSSYRFAKVNLDSACKDKKCEFFDSGFAFVMRFTGLPDNIPIEQRLADVNDIPFIPVVNDKDDNINIVGGDEGDEELDEDDEERPDKHIKRCSIMDSKININNVINNNNDDDDDDDNNLLHNGKSYSPE